MARRNADEGSELWGTEKPVVGVVHLRPLPGSPRWGGSLEEVTARALADATRLQEGGADGVLVENFGDAPFFPGPVPPETVAAMAVVARAVVAEVGLPTGVNVLRNDAAAALAVAVAAGARFIRVNVHTGSMFTDQGLLEGRAHETLRTRRSLGVPISILADVFVKHATPPQGATLEGSAGDTWHRGLADGIIVTGGATGEPVEVDHLRKVRQALPDEAQVWTGSGVTPATARKLQKEAYGMIVGSALQAGGRAGGGVEVDRVRDLMKALGRRG